MGQHFLLSKESVTRTVEDVSRLTDEQAAEVFRLARWPQTDGEPVCPRCHCSAVYTLKSRAGKWKCQRCERQFSVTAGTTFHSRKLHLRKILIAILMQASSSKGMNAVEMRYMLGTAHKTNFVLLHKIREVLAKEPLELSFSGEVEIDGVYIGGKQRKRNWVHDRTDRRKFPNGKRRVVVTLRERNGSTISYVFKTEAEAVDKILGLLNPDKVEIYADQAPHWDQLEVYYRVYRVNHEECYSDGMAHTNWVESFNGRIRYTERGAYRKISGPYLLAYVREASFREYYRRYANGSKSDIILARCLASLRSQVWTGYWQKRKVLKPKKWWV